jgi:hypothetical protein
MVLPAAPIVGGWIAAGPLGALAGVVLDIILLPIFYPWGPDCVFEGIGSIIIEDLKDILPKLLLL